VAHGYCHVLILPLRSRPSQLLQGKPGRSPVRPEGGGSAMAAVPEAQHPRGQLEHNGKRIGLLQPWWSRPFVVAGSAGAQTRA